ncbi:MAG: protein kinase [Candidatus Aminicenantaceae bacterium]
MSVKCPKCNSDNPPISKFCKKCGTKLPLPEDISTLPTGHLKTAMKDLTRGSTFAGRYEVIEELGKGGMGTVYRVFDKKIEEEVALKLINPEIAADKKTIERFRDELKIARKIAHRNVCQMYDLGEEEGTYYITLEYIPGEDLKSFIRRSRQFTPETALYIARQVCEGLAEAHSLGIVNRDLKPGNIMIDKEGNARIMDFGIACSPEEKGITGNGVIIGTPEYMSPEQVEGKRADIRSDIYSLGVILYEMVTGKVPFEGDILLSIALKQKTKVPKNPKELNAQVPSDLSRLILRCIEKDKERRYQTPEELISELTKIEKGILAAEREIPKRRLEIKLNKFLKYGGAVIILILLIVAGILLIPKHREPINSIAVLPLENLSGDPEQDYFVDGMTDALITELSKIGALKRVISRQSVMNYKNTDKLLPEIARELNVDAIVEGSVLVIGEKVRIAAQLIEARTDRHLWVESYERDLKDIFDLQSEVARKIAKEIKATMTPEEQIRLGKFTPVNPDVYQLYLRGRFFWNKRTEKDLKKAIEYFEEAVKADPDYALAYAGLADSYQILPEYSSFPSEEAYQKSNEAALKALEIDESLAEAHVSLAANKHDYEWDWVGAEREFKRAIELNPGYATAHFWYAYHLVHLARLDEAIKEIKRAHELDPFSLVINRWVGTVFYNAHRFEEAIDALQMTLEMDPTILNIHMMLGLTYLAKSMYEEALAEFQKEKELRGRWHPRIEACIGITYARMGKRAEAAQVLEDLLERSKKADFIPYYLAHFYFALGENDKGFELLEKASEKLRRPLSSLKVDPLLDGVRSDPRFAALLRKMGLE